MLIWGVISCLMKGTAATVTVYEPSQFLDWAYGITIVVTPSMADYITKHKRVTAGFDMIICKTPMKLSKAG